MNEEHIPSFVIMLKAWPWFVLKYFLVDIPFYVLLIFAWSVLTTFVNTLLIQGERLSFTLNAYISDQNFSVDIWIFVLPLFAQLVGWLYEYVSGRRIVQKWKTGFFVGVTYFLFTYIIIPATLLLWFNVTFIFVLILLIPFFLISFVFTFLFYFFDEKIREVVYSRLKKQLYGEKR